MDLRYRLAVVTGAGAGLGREVAVALGRAGAAVLVVDRDLAAAEHTAAEVRTSRVSSWALQAEVTEEAERLMLAARARDLGGMDLLVTGAGGQPPAPRQRPQDPTSDVQASTRLTELFLAGLPERRGRRDGTPAVVTIGCTTSLEDPAAAADARVMAVVPGPVPLERAGLPPSGQQPALSFAAVTRAVLHLLREGTAGEVVELTGGSSTPVTADGAGRRVDRT